MIVFDYVRLHSFVKRRRIEEFPAEDDILFDKHSMTFYHDLSVELLSVKRGQ
jgi:hypothetical protein